jgi:hypothetical protein
VTNDSVVAENALAPTHHERVDHQTEFIDEVPIDQVTHQGRAADHEDVAPVRFFPRHDRAGQVTGKNRRVLPGERIAEGRGGNMQATRR